jgi:hypothetical protein
MDMGLRRRCVVSHAVMALATAAPPVALMHSSRCRNAKNRSPELATG